MAYYWENGLLVRKWVPPHSEGLGWNAVYQLVVPAKFRGQVLLLGHDHYFAGKPNQVIPPTPFRPIPIMGEAFECIILDYVGQLPKTKSGHCFLLAVMCAATRYPEAIPLCLLKAKPIVQVLILFNLWVASSGTNRPGF